MTRLPEMACRRCLVPLNITGVPPRYVHPLSAERPDHQPDPTPVADLETVARRCDFCGDPYPLWTITGADVTAIALGDRSGLLQDFGDRWAACAPCMIDIDRNTRERIVDRAVAHPDLRGDPRVRTEIRRLHDLFLAERRPGRTLITTTAWPATALHPRDLPKVRDRLARLNRGPDTLPAPFDDPTIREACASDLDRSTLYWVDPNFTDLAGQAANSLPDTTADAAQAPATSGLLVWAAPIPPHDLVAVSWAATRDTCRVTRYRPVGGGLGGLPLQRVREQVGWLIPVHTTELTSTDVITARDPLAAVTVTWLLIDQQVADEQPARLEPRIQRPYLRAGRPPPEVRVIRIRSHAPGDDRTASSDPPRHGLQRRFWVRGHWRNQPYGPGRALRRPVFIHPFLKGPDDQPIQQRTAIRVLGSTPPRDTQPGDGAGRADA